MINLVGKLHKGSKDYNRRSLAQIKQIVLHHSGTEGGNPESFSRYHVQNNNWPGIGYHYVIDKHGEIYMTQLIDTLSYHVRGKNTISVGVCLIGNFDISKPTIEQLSALNEVIFLIRQIVGENIPLVPHRNFQNKSCPGSYFHNKRVELISQTYGIE